MAAQLEPAEMVRIEPFAGATFGATVTGADLERLSGEEWEEIEAAFHEHALLLFPGQQAMGARRDGDDGVIRFAARFGDVQNDLPITNIDAETGETMELDEYGIQILRGNEDWHVDQTFQRVQAKAGILFAYESPEQGGQTGFADMRAAYEALDGGLRDQVQSLHAFHSLKYSTARRGHFPEQEQQLYDSTGQKIERTSKRDLVPLNGDVWGNNTAYFRPLVKQHPVTGRPSLLIGRHAFGIPGMSPSESEAFLAALLADAVQPPRVCAHQWQAGDMIVYDNRCLLHRACDYDGEHPRVLRSIRIAGDPETESSLPPPSSSSELLLEELERLRVRTPPMLSALPYEGWPGEAQPGQAKL